MSRFRLIAEEEQPATAIDHMLAGGVTARCLRLVNGLPDALRQRGAAIVMVGYVTAILPLRRAGTSVSIASIADGDADSLCRVEENAVWRSFNELGVFAEQVAPPFAADIQ